MKNIGRALELKKELDSLRPFNKEDELRVMQKFRLDWNYHSNHIEGNSLTYGETKALILFGITAQGKPLKDHFEISGHDKAIKWIMDIIMKNRPISENFIRELHTLVLKESYIVNAITPEGKPTKKLIKVGEYKSTPNHVKTKTGEIFRFANPEETPALMNDLIDWYKNKISDKSFNPILVASEFHYKFIRIHPFDDGNGRVARILMNFILLQYGFPPVIIKTDDKNNYFSVLRQADAGSIEPFIEYIGENLVYSLKIMIKGAKGTSIEEPDDIDKEISLLENQLKSVSQPINILKNKETILKIYDDSIHRLLRKYIEKAKLFDKFYIKSKFLLFIDNGATRNENKIDAHTICRKSVKDDTNAISIIYNYLTINQVGLENFNYFSQIDIQFDLTKYIVSDSKKEIVLDKLYSEELTKDEINDIVNIEVRRHTKAIENKIKEINKKK